jgi:hypothetical protein
MSADESPNSVDGSFLDYQSAPHFPTISQVIVHGVWCDLFRLSETMIFDSKSIRDQLPDWISKSLTLNPIENLSAERKLNNFIPASAPIACA